MSPFREVLNAFLKSSIQIHWLSRKIAPKCAGGTPTRQPPERQRYETLYSTANRRCLPGEALPQLAWISPEPDSRRCFVPSTRLRAFVLLASVGKCNPPITWIGHLRSLGTTVVLVRQRPSDCFRAGTIPMASMFPG